MDTATQEMRDPVCGMTVEPASAAEWRDHGGRRYYFCASSCAAKFSTDPEAFLAKRTGRADAPLVPGAGGYTCPMHPDVHSDTPGDCPICGMALDPVMPSADDDGHEQVREVGGRLAWSAACTIPLAILSMAQMFHVLPACDTAGGAAGMALCWLQFVLATPVVVVLARPFFAKGLASLRSGLNMFTLLSLGIGIPYLASIVSLLTLTLNRMPQSADHDMHLIYFESSAVIATLSWLGQFLEVRARQSSTSAVKELLELAPAEATLIGADGQESRVHIQDVQPQARLRVKPGERFAVDGIVAEGTSSVDESMLTGEALPVLKTPGSHVYAGTMNANGSLLVVAEQVGPSTMLSKIAGLVSQAQRSRVPVQQLVDRIASVFVPFVLLVAVATAGGWVLAGAPTWQALSAATAVLVVACPCALGLATPMSIVVAAGRAAKAGVLFKEARSLQLLTAVNTLVVDKTGTLTEGKPAVTEIRPQSKVKAEDVLAAAAAVEALSEHPLARAIGLHAKNSAVIVANCTEFASEPGRGARARVGGALVAVGTAAFLADNGIGLPGSVGAGTTPGGTLVHVGRDGTYLGYIVLADQLRATAAAAVNWLTRAGIRVIIASGDSQPAVQSAAQAAGIKEYHGGLLPADKAELVKKLQAEGATVAMAGDGINDAPALAQANVGIALSAGADIAVEAADIVLMQNDIAGIVRAWKISRAMLTNVRQNLFLAFAYNVVAVPAAAGVFVPMGGPMFDPMSAAAAMSVSSVAVILNALRLRNLRLS